MIQARLNDAAIALSEILEAADINHGIFGGFAIGTLGGPRESKDIDCLAAISKPEIVALLDGTDGFALVSQSRDDYVAFLWSEKADRSQAVLVEIFVDDFKGMHPCSPSIQSSTDSQSVQEQYSKWMQSCPRRNKSRDNSSAFEPSINCQRP